MGLDEGIDGSLELVHAAMAAAAQFVERAAEIHGVPEYDRGTGECEPARTVVLHLGCTIAQPA